MTSPPSIQHAGTTHHPERTPPCRNNNSQEKSHSSPAPAQASAKQPPSHSLTRALPLSSALDAKTRAEMQALAAELLTGRTVLHVTHDVAEAARMGHRVLLMTTTGIEALTPPPAPPLRAFDAPHTLEFQGRLLRRMMETA